MIQVVRALPTQNMFRAFSQHTFKAHIGYRSANIIRINQAGVRNTFGSLPNICLILVRIRSTSSRKHILGWKSPHYQYHCAMNPNLKLLLRDFKLSDDISLRFSNSEWNEYPLFADKYIDWIAALVMISVGVEKVTPLSFAQTGSAFNKLYSVAERVHLCDDRRIKRKLLLACKRT